MDVHIDGCLYSVQKEDVMNWTLKNQQSINLSGTRGVINIE